MKRTGLIFVVCCVFTQLTVESRPMDPMNYLTSFGYLPTNKIHSDRDMRDAVMNFQLMANVEMTGELDSATMEMMAKPRCGVEDMIGSAVMGTHMNDTDNSMFMSRHKRYALGTMWSKTDLTYSFVSFTDDLSIADQKGAIARAFKHWSDVTPLTFTEVPDSNGDILIEFADDIHSDGIHARFDGPGGVLAHAYFPESGDAHFDDAETFTVDSYEGINLDFVAAHEFGHSLGLAHSSVPGALMAPFYRGYDPDFTLPQDDISGIQALYGEPVRTTPTEPTIGMTTNIPDVCNTTFDTIFMDADENTYVTKGKYIWLVHAAGIADNYPKNIEDVYPGLPSDIATAFTSPWTHRTFFFKGRRVWRYTRRALDEGYPKRTDKTGLPRDPDAAFVWSGDGKIYIFKGSRYYIWDEFTERVNPGAVRRLRKHWRGLPRGINAAFQWTNRRTYFFKDGDYWRYDDLAMQVEDGYPKSTARWWIGCDGLVIAGRLRLS